MPTIDGYDHLNLSVSDLTRSATWYCQVLGFTKLRERETPNFRRVILRHAEGGISLGLTSHHATGPQDVASEFRTGLDHIAFAVHDRVELEAWEQRLSQMGVDHSSIKRSTGGFLITFRDPDNIQLELYAPET